MAAWALVKAGRRSPRRWGAPALSQRPDLDSIVLSIEAKLRRAGKGKRLVIENGAGAEINAGLAAVVAKAFAIRNQ
jgi:site-specific DNA recombinase